jgi:hypothetical protein
LIRPRSYDEVSGGEQPRSLWRSMFGSRKEVTVGQEAVGMMRAIKQLNPDVADGGVT